MDSLLQPVIESYPKFSIEKKVSPSYVQMYTKNKIDIALVCTKNRTSSNQLDPAGQDNRCEKEELELTGSPLKLDLSLHTILDDTLVSDEPQLWSKEEGTHIPVSIDKARDIANLYHRSLTSVTKDESLPMWILTNPATDGKPLLLTIQSDERNFSRGIVSYEGAMTLDEVDVDTLVQEFCAREKLSSDMVSTTVDCKFLLSGISYGSHSTEELLNAPHGGVTELHCEWQGKMLQIPYISCKVLFEQEVIVGHLASPCNAIWKSVCALHNINQLLVDMTAAGLSSVNLKNAVVRAFAKKLRERYFQKGYLVLRANEVLNSMYIIYRGKVDIVSDDNEVEACMGPGGIFGNIKGASKYLTQSNVIASRNIDLLVIQGNEFYSLLKSYPSVLRKVKNCVENAPKDYVLPSVISGPEHTSLEDESTYPISYESGDDEEEYENANIDLNDESPQRSTAEISSHGSRSILSTANADYIPASLLLFKPHRWLRSSVIPDCALVSFMDLLTMVLSYIDFMCLIYQMAFQSIPYFFHFCMVFDVIFLYKTFLDVHTGYVNRYGEYVLKPEKVRKMKIHPNSMNGTEFSPSELNSHLTGYIYLAWMMKSRVFTSGVFLQNIPSKTRFASQLADLLLIVCIGLFTYLRTPQLFRITYLFTFRTHRKINIGSANLIFKLAYIGIMASILAHVNACLFFKLSCLTPIHCTSTNWMSKQELNLRPKYKSKSYFSIYIAALWYIINLLTITGTGDVSSQNNFEVIETIIIVIIIKFCTGLLISEMSGMITAHSSSRIAYDYVINALRDGLRDMDLSLHQMNKMWDYVRELWNRHQGRQMPELICSLPFRLQCQVMQAVYGCHIKDSIIFSKTDDDFKRMLCMWIRHCVFFPGNYIVQCGDSDQCIYFIHRGEVEVLTVHQNLTESVYDILGPEDSFGIAQGLFVGVCHHFSFRARTVVDIVYLKLEQWKYLLDFYPKAAKVVQKKVENVYLAI